MFVPIDTSTRIQRVRIVYHDGQYSLWESGDPLNGVLRLWRNDLLVMVITTLPGGYRKEEMIPWTAIRQLEMEPYTKKE